MVLRGAFERPAGVLVCDVCEVESAGPWARCTGVANLKWENGLIPQRVTCPDADSEVFFLPFFFPVLIIKRRPWGSSAKHRSPSYTSAWYAE